MHTRFDAALALTLLYVACAHAAQPSWIDESNRHAQVLLEIIAKYTPESAASLGVEGHDTEILDLQPRFVERQQADLETAIATLQAARGAAADLRVQQDLEILLD